MFVDAMPRAHNEATVEDIVKVFKDLGVPEEKLRGARLVRRFHRSPCRAALGHSEVHSTPDEVVDRDCPRRALHEFFEGQTDNVRKHGCECCQLCTEQGAFCIDGLEDCREYDALGQKASSGQDGSVSESTAF